MGGGTFSRFLVQITATKNSSIFTIVFSTQKKNESELQGSVAWQLQEQCRVSKLNKELTLSHTELPTQAYAE